MKAFSFDPFVQFFMHSLKLLFEKLGKDYDIKAIKKEADKLKGKKMDVKNP